MPSVALARRLAKTRGLQGVIVIGIASGRFSVASWAETPRRSDELGKLADFIIREVELGVVPMESFEEGAE